MKCVYCERDTERNEYFPFCSERCQLLDLYNWFYEGYYISDKIPEKEEENEDFWRN